MWSACPKKARLLHLILDSMFSRRVRSFISTFVCTENSGYRHTSQAVHVKSLQSIDIGLEQDPCLGAIQEHGQDAHLIDSKLC